MILDLTNVPFTRRNSYMVISYITDQFRLSSTGDVFSAIIAADAVHDIDFRESVKRASSFVKKCIEVTETFDIPPTDGVCFEEVLHTLKCN